MTVSVITITEPIGVNRKTNKNANIYATSVAGGAAGLAVRHFLPVYKNEMDTVLFNATDAIKENNIKQVKASVMKEVKDAFLKDHNNEALKLFQERLSAFALRDDAVIKNDASLLNVAVNVANNAKKKIKEAPEAVQKEVKELMSDTINKFKASRFLTENTIKASVKQQRPIAAFLLPGLALGALAGFVYNVVGAISKD